MKETPWQYDEYDYVDAKSASTDYILLWSKIASDPSSSDLQRYYATRHLVDCKKEVTGQNPDYRTERLQCVLSGLAVLENIADDRLYEGITIAKDVAERSLSIGNLEYFNKAVKSMLSLDSRNTDDSLAGIWRVPIELLLENPEKMSSCEKEIIQTHEDRFNRLYILSIENGSQTDSYVHKLHDETKLLCEYYRSKKRVADTKEKISKLVKCIRLSIECRGALWGQAMIQQMQELYRHNGLNKEADLLFVDIQNMAKKVSDCKERISTSVSIKNEDIEKCINEFISGSPQEVLERCILNFIPDMDKEKERFRGQAQYSVLDSLLAVTKESNEGLPLSVIGKGKNAEQHRITNSIAFSIQVGSTFLHMLFQRMISMNILSVESLMAMLKDNPLIEKSHENIFKRGFEAYFSKDYLVAMHLLIPQFENAIRKFNEINQEPIIKPKKNPEEGNLLCTLDDLLNTSAARENLCENIRRYYRILYTDSNGLNLRNEICHGMRSADSFDEYHAARVIHSIMTFSLFKYTSID